MDIVGIELDVGILVFSAGLNVEFGLKVTFPTGVSVSSKTGGPVVMLVGATEGAAGANAVQLLASKKGIQSNAQSVLLTWKHPLSTCSRTSLNPSSAHTELT